MTRELTHYVGGAHVEGTSGRFSDVYNPSTGAVQSKLPLASAEEVRDAIAVAEAAQVEWGQMNPQRRARILNKFVELVYANMDELAALLTSEHGKTFPDSKGDIQRGLRGHRVLRRGPAPAQGRILRQCRNRHRRALDAPAAGRGRRHHAVQLPGDDPAVEGRPGPGLRATPTSSSPPSATPPCRCAWPSSSPRQACPMASSTSSTATRRRWTRCSRTRG